MAVPSQFQIYRYAETLTGPLSEKVKRGWTFLAVRSSQPHGLWRQDYQPKKGTTYGGEKKNAQHCVAKQQVCAFLIW